MNYRKLRKLIATPRQFFIDALNNKINKSSTRHSGIKNNSAPTTQNINSIPEWFNTNCASELDTKINTRQTVFVYIPWITEHSNALIEKLNASEHFTILPLKFVKDITDNNIRKQVARFAREHPDIYRKMLVRSLGKINKKIKGVVFTFDWAPAMRIMANVCEELEIPRILIPHESIFIDRDKYYVDTSGLSSLPVADVTLGWGNLQKDIFIERGYSEDRFISVGSPKFDTYHNYQPYLTKKQFYRLFGLNENKKTILFAAQPLDSQTNTEKARESQRQAICDLIDYVTEKKIQLLIRLPPSKDAILHRAIKDKIDESDNIRVDDADCYLVTPEETLFHSDLVSSINSTMLLEGVLLSKPALSIKYIEFKQTFEQIRIRTASDRTELFTNLDRMLSCDWSFPEDGLQLAAHLFGIGKFDGLATKRIYEHLEKIAKNEIFISLNSTSNRINNNLTLDVVGIPSANSIITTGTQKHLQKMLNIRTLISTRDNQSELSKLFSVEAFLQWGITESNNKKRQREASAKLSRPIFIIEDGFIRSVDIGLSGTPGLSVIIDDITAYYDATQESSLSKIIQSDLELSEDQKNRARNAIDKIVANKVSKYNHAKCLPIKIGSAERKKILIIDQRFGDQSVISGLADEFTFEKMLNDAIANHPECDIIIKQHPDAIKGGKSSYYSDERLAFTKYVSNVYTVNFDINPYCLLNLVEEVYVVTSGMGFEALMAGKKVHCYGMPFYAGWGITEDQIKLVTRTRKRTLEEIFYFSYIEKSRYFDPDLDKQVQVEEMVDYIIKHRKW